MKRPLIILLLIAVPVACYLILFKCNRPPSEEQEIWLGTRAAVGHPAPDFILPTLEGNAVHLTDHRGRVIFLNFWATWCHTCREEMPSMESLYQRLKGRDFEILAVSIDNKGADLVRSFVATYSLTFPVLLDPKKAIYSLYGLTGVPETFIIDRNGDMVLKIIGSQDWMKKQWLDYFDRITR